MHRSIRIVLAKPAAPLPPGADARAAAGTHWRHWRAGGAALSALLHVLAVAALTVSVPVFGRQAETEQSIPVEIVPPPAPKAVEMAEPDAKREADKREAAALPPAPKPAPEAPLPAAKPAPAPASPRPEAKAPPAPPLAAPPAALARPALPPPAPPPWTGLEPYLPPAAPEPPRPAGPAAGLKVDADEAAPPPGRRGLGYWVLDPVTVNLRHACGLARITGVLELEQRIAEGRYRGTMRTRIAWSSCPPEGVVHQVELRIRGGQVEMVGASFVDRGVIGSNTMLLEDRYGRSVWRKR